MRQPMSRREFLRRCQALGAALAARAAASPLHADRPAPETMPRIRVGTFELSRLVLDSQPFFGQGHWRYLVCKAMFQYFTDERIVETLDRAAAAGVDTMLARPGRRDGQDLYKLHEACLQRGGKLTNLLAEHVSKGTGEDYAAGLAAKKDVRCAFIGPGRTDAWFQAGSGGFRTLQRVLGKIDKAGGCTAVAVNDGDLLPDYERYADRGLLKIDLFVQTGCTSHDYPAKQREKALQAIRSVNRPVILRDVLPADAPAGQAQAVIEEVLKRLPRKDGLCLGVFPRDDPAQIDRYAALVKRLTVGPLPPATAPATARSG